MNKIILILITLIFPFTAMAKLNVVTTTPDLAAIAQAIGGEQVTVKSIARADEDPHYLEPKPSYIVLANRADLLVEVGLQLEIGWLPVLMTQARNPKIQTGLPGHLDASQGVHIEEISTGTIDRSQGDVHPDGNPHYWLDPHNGLLIAQEIADHLIALDGKNEAYYQAQLSAFKPALTGKIAGWEKEAASLKGKKAISYHKNFSYLTSWLGINEVGYIEPKPGIPPTPSHTLSLIDMIQAQRVPIILSASYYDSKAAQEIARKTSAKVLILPSSVGAGDTKTYFDLFEAIIKKLKEAA